MLSQTSVGSWLESAVVMALVAGFRLLGQAAPGLDPGLGSLLGSIGIMGVLVWYLWYHTTHAQPKMLDSFSLEMDKLREVFAKEQASLREVFAKEQSALREAFAKEQAAIRQDAATEKAELRSMLIQALAAYRVAVHDVKDTAQTALNKIAVENKLAKREDT